MLGLSEQEIYKIREAISKANTLEEMERLQKMLQAGQIPGEYCYIKYSRVCVKCSCLF